MCEYVRTFGCRLCLQQLSFSNICHHVSYAWNWPGSYFIHEPPYLRYILVSKAKLTDLVWIPGTYERLEQAGSVAHMLTRGQMT